MSLYVDTSALLKRYVDEPESPTAERYLLADPSWITARHTRIEIRRNLARLLQGPPLARARTAFEIDWKRIHVVELDEITCDIAVQLAESSGLRTLDALHLAALRRLGDAAIPLLSFDVRQAQAARALGLTALGA